MFALIDIGKTIIGIFHSVDIIQLALMAVVAIGMGLVMKGWRSIASITLLALLAYVVLTFIRAIALQHANPGPQLAADWKAFEAMHTVVLLSYAILFGAVIAVVNTVRILIRG